MIRKRKAAPTFYLPDTSSPTYYNLHHYLLASQWRLAPSSTQVDFGVDNLAFDEQAALCLEYKHLLAELLTRHCPDVMPFTLTINDDNWQEVINKAAQSGLSLWILKPSLLNNGEGIKLFQNLNELKRHYLGSARFGGPHVLQHYLAYPHLLRDKRKYSIRHFMVLTNYAGAFLYPYGYFNVSRYPFSLDLSDLRPHLTNEHLLGYEPNVIQIPSVKFEFYKTVYPQIKILLQKVIAGLQETYPQAFTQTKHPALALFGVDFMLDESGRLWLLEINHGPCFPVEADHPLQTYLYEDFWQALIADFITPIVEKTPTRPLSFEILPPK